MKVSFYVTMVTWNLISNCKYAFLQKGIEIDVILFHVLISLFEKVRQRERERGGG